jgi:soluble lytic murein transglycosylase-like protein
MGNPAKEGCMIPDPTFELKGADVIRERVAEIRARMGASRAPGNFKDTLKKVRDTQSDAIVPLRPDDDLNGDPILPPADAGSALVGPITPRGALRESAPLIPSSRVQIQALINQVASEQGVDQRLLRAVVEAESDFNPGEVSNKGAMGLMQLMPGTAKELGVGDPFNPYQNLTGGARYLKSMLRQFNGDVSLALAAYNAGPGAVREYGGIPNYPETKNYVKKILGRLN